jgi:hypothetical protein
MKLKSLALGIAALSAIVVPVGALSAERASAPVESANEFAGVPIFALLIGGAALFTAIVVAATDDDEPVSG